MTDGVELDGGELIATRTVNAAPDLVWDVFTQPEHLAAFWGGDHATVPLESVAVDLRVGGLFELETRSADGRSHPLRFRYDLVDAPRRLVLSEANTGITTDIRLEPKGRSTRVVVHQRRLPPELQTEQARVGLAGILQRLDELVRDLAIDDRSEHP